VADGEVRSLVELTALLFSGKMVEKIEDGGTIAA